MGREMERGGSLRRPAPLIAALLGACASGGVLLVSAAPRASAPVQNQSRKSDFTKRRRLIDTSGRFTGGVLRGRALDTAEVRYTFNRCECKTSWELEEIGSCATSCCNPDEDPLGKWCMVKDAACEESDFGYCRPANVTMGSCTDEPIFWSDSEGDSCGVYASELFCSPDGGYGSGWNSEWGTFDDFALGGVPATKACCQCGGGSQHLLRCKDVEGWSDSDGDDCKSYQESAWCTKDGHTGVGWHDEWGTIEDKKKDSKTAYDACCSCGGGKKNHAPLQEGSLQRWTWSGCACKKEWGNCKTYCCVDEGDTEASCEVQDWNCEMADWGYCRPEDWKPEREDACTNKPTGWRDDKIGYSCRDFEDLHFCKQNGKKGPGWNDRWGDLEKIKGGGKNALQVCCACGGGDTHKNGLSFMRDCRDYSGWSDADGDTCQVYADYSWCTEGGKPGVGWHLEEWGSIESHGLHGITATDACCACGGGLDPGETQPAIIVTPAHPGEPRYTQNGCPCKPTWTLEGLPTCYHTCCNPDSDPFGEWCMVEDDDCESSDFGYCREEAQGIEEFETCDNEPHGWRDAEGDTCMDYSSKGWCDRNGNTGPNWEKDWGKIESFGRSGHSALDVCCECGGGKKFGESIFDMCENSPDWADNDGDGCDSYEDYNWCTSRGTPGPGWHEEWGVFTGHPTAVKACCACGGGRRELLPTLEKLENIDPQTGAALGGGFFVIILCLILAAFGCWRFLCRSEDDPEGLGAGHTRRDAAKIGRSSEDY